MAKIPRARSLRDEAGARKPTRFVGAQVDSATHAELLRVAAAHDVSSADVIRYVLAEMLPRLRNGAHD